MLLPRAFALLCLAAISAKAQDSTSSSTTTTQASTSDFDGFSYTNALSTVKAITTVPTGPYASVTGQTTVQTTTETVTDGDGSVHTLTSTLSSNSQITVSTSSASLIVIGGSSATTTGNATATSSSATATNTVACNGFTEFCDRKYSNITMVTAHNAAFDIKNNAASNQIYPITDQLDDGVRMLSGEVHYVNNTLYNCHTSCSLLNAGTWEAELVTLREWIEDNPYNVVTVLIVNSDFVSVEDFVAPITNSGLLPYAYLPEYIPQYRDQWPTLGEMILTGKRVVFFMDYEADQATVPYILDEFTHIWETPFSPTDQSFPCTLQRPPGLNTTIAREQYMYLANHNLNTAVDLSSLGITADILIPNTAEINITNGAGNTYGELGAMTNNCTADWGRPPNFLLVDYYNYGSPAPPGSVFRVAATANDVVYTQSCCGTTSDATSERASCVGLIIALVAVILFAW